MSITTTEAQISELMSADPICVKVDDSLQTAAALMAANDIGDCLVVNEDEQFVGIVTDRDIVVRCLAENSDLSDATIKQAYTPVVETLSPDSTVQDATERMRSYNVRRLPVIDEQQIVGIVSLGDLARERDKESVLGEISSSPSNN